jgi:ABC-type glycerol-3-phosphate transport system permease component
VKTYIESIPPTLEEAAEIDGAGYFKRYLFIALPLSKPILATIAVFSAVGQWNSFMDTVYLMTDESLFTLQFVLYRYLNEAAQLAELMRRGANLGDVISSRAMTPVAVRFTVASVTIIPILLAYPFFQRYFEKGLMLGAVKG